MYQDFMMEMRRTPLVYETTDLAFWDDEHISESMLTNHLNPDSAGATREHSIAENSIRWLMSLPAPGSKVLDLGCGPGLYANPFAEAGHEVTGVDISRCSIDYAKASAESAKLKIEYFCEDYLHIDFPNDTFDLATLIYCDYGVLPPESRAQLLEKINRVLKPGGLLVFDVFTPCAYQSFTDSSSVTYEEGGFWSDAPHVLISIKKAYPEHHYLERYLVVTREECLSYNIWNHAFSEHELISGLDQAGFSNVELYSNTLGTSFDVESETICVVAKKQ